MVVSTSKFQRPVTNIESQREMTMKIPAVSTPRKTRPSRSYTTEYKGSVPDIQFRRSLHTALTYRYYGVESTHSRWCHTVMTKAWSMIPLSGSHRKSVTSSERVCLSGSMVMSAKNLSFNLMVSIPRTRREY
jgi:hypothetical protein